MILRQLEVHPHKLGNAHTFGEVVFYREAVSFHYRTVVLLMRPTKFRRHCDLIVKIGKRTIRIKCAGVKNCLRRFFDFCFLLVCRCRPREVVVDNSV